MAREWQQTRMQEYVLPNAVYYQSLWAVRDLRRMERRLAQLQNQGDSRKTSSLVCDGGGSELSRPTENRALELINLRQRIGAIQRALTVVPEVYRSCVIQNIVDRNTGVGFPDKIWRIWKQRFLFQVAINLGLF